MTVGPFRCNCYVFGDESTGKALVVDPGDDISEIEALLSRLGLEAERIVITHAHFDHVGQAAKFKASTGARAAMRREEVPMLEAVPTQATKLGFPVPELLSIDDFVEAGDVIEGGGVSFEVRATPGHTPGALSLYAPNENLIVGGDVLFRESIGRTDLPGSDHATLLETIKREFLSLDDSTTVLPGHGPATTIGHERRNNPFLQGLAAD